MFFLYLLIEIIIVLVLSYFTTINEQNMMFKDLISSINFINEPDPCKNIHIQCKVDTDCDKCLHNKYSCVDGYCNKRMSSKITCDESLGMYAILIKSDGVDTYKCISIYPLYFNDKGEPHEYFCKNGFINNVQSRIIDDRLCVCDKYKYKKIYVQNIPTCVRNDKLYTM